MFFRKLEIYLRYGLFSENIRITDRSLLKVKFQVLTAALKDKKSYYDNMKENLYFKQSRLNYINNQNQKKKITHKISNSLYWGRCGCQN